MFHIDLRQQLYWEFRRERITENELGKTRNYQLEL